MKFTVEIEMPEFSPEFKASPYCPYKNEEEYLTSVLRNAYYSPDIKWTIRKEDYLGELEARAEEVAKFNEEQCKKFDHGTFSGCPAHPNSKYPPTNLNYLSEIQ